MTEPNIPHREIVGNQEVRAMCGGITRHTLIRRQQTMRFPKPFRVLACGELWDARQVRAWIEARK